MSAARSRAAVAQHGDRAQAMVAARDHRRLRAPRHPLHLALARPSCRGGPQGNGAAHSRRRAYALSGYCRGGMFPAADREGRRAALDDNKRAVDEAWHSARRASCSSSAGCRRIATARSCRRISPARAKWCATASASCSNTRTPPGCRWRSSRCIRCTPRIAPASTRWRTRTSFATSSATGIGIAVDVYHVWWDPHLQREIERAGGHSKRLLRVSHLRLARADHRPPARSRDDGRRRDRPSAHSLVDGRRGISRPARSRDLFRRTTGGSAIRTKSCEPCQARHQDRS